MKFFIFFSTFIFFICSNLFGQNQTDIDSLKTLLSTDISDKDRVLVFNKLAYQYSNTDSGLVAMYTSSAIELAVQIKDNSAIAESYHQLGWVTMQKGDYLQAEELFSKVIQFAQKSNDRIKEAQGLNAWADLKRRNGNATEALDYYFKALKIFEQNNHKKGIATCNNNMAYIYGIIQENPQKAIDYLKKSLLVFEELGNQHALAMCYNNIGLFYSDLSELEKAQEFYAKCINTEDKLGKALAYSNLGDLYLQQNKFNKAQEILDKALKLDKEIGDKYGIGSVYIKLSEIYKSRGLYSMAKEHLEQSVHFGKEIGSPDLVMDATENLAEINSLTGNFQEAYSNHKLFKELEDSIQNLENIKEFALLETQYIFSKREDSLRIVQANETELLNAELDKKNLAQAATATGLGLTSLLILVLIWAYRNKIRSNHKLNEVNTQLSSFNTIITNTNEKLKEANDESKALNESLQSTLSVVQQQNIKISDSISYAKRIQEAILPSKKKLDCAFQNYFMLFKPRDVVSGDFYWMSDLRQTHGKIVFAVIDCTGHGVPGAFMSMVGNDLLNYIVNEKQVLSPDLILTHLNLELQQALHQRETRNKDGMDLSLIVIDERKNILEFAGAKNPLIYIQDGILHKLKGDIFSLGGYKVEEGRIFKKQVVQLDKPTSIYMYSDGYQDQFGGYKNRKFMSLNLRNLFFEIHKKPMCEQRIILEETLEKWINDGKETQIDDILLFGIKL